MPKKILIVDYTTHHQEVVNSLCTLFCDHDVSLALTESFVKKFGTDFAITPRTLLVRPKKTPDKSWLEQLKPLMAQQDIVIVSTAIRSPLLHKTLALPTHAKKIVFVHNTHYFTENFPLKAREYKAMNEAESSGLKSMMHYTSKKTEFIKKNIKHSLQGSRFADIAPLVDFFCFGSEHLARYFTALTGHTAAVVLPTNTLAIELPRPAFDGTLRIAILGTISADRRDYLSVINTLGAAQFDRPVELLLLGACKDRLYGAQIQAAIDASTNKKLQVKFAVDRGFIPLAELNATLASTHLLLSPIRLDFSFQLYRERYGLTKISGAESDCAAFNRPMLLPRNYLCGQRVASYVVYYDENENLASVINTLTCDDALDALYERIAQQPASAANRALRDEFLAQVEVG